MIVLSNPVALTNYETVAPARVEAYWVSGVSGAGAADEAKAFIASVKAETGRMPHPATLAAYDGVKLFLNGLEKMGAAQQTPSRAGARRQLSQTTVYQGLAQRYEFDGRGRVLNPSVYVLSLHGSALDDHVEAKVAVPAAR